MQGVIGKLVFGVVDPFNDAGLAQRRQVGVNAFYVTFDQAGNLADAERTGTSHGFQQVHALRGEYLPEKLVGGEADARGLALAGLEGFGTALLDRRQRANIDQNSFHLRLKFSTTRSEENTTK